MVELSTTVYINAADYDTNTFAAELRDDGLTGHYATHRRDQYRACSFVCLLFVSKALMAARGCSNHRC